MEFWHFSGPHRVASTGGGPANTTPSRATSSETVFAPRFVTDPKLKGAWERHAETRRSWRLMSVGPTHGKRHLLIHSAAASSASRRAARHASDAASNVRNFAADAK